MPVNRVEKITAVSTATKNDIIRHTGCSPSKITVIPTCIGVHFKRVDKPFNATKPVILQVGTAENKNCIRMAKALHGISCTLQIVGKPSAAYLDVLKECNIDYHISSHLSDEEMLQQYIDCDILLFASTYEGFGMPIIEANTVGRVVITSNCSSMPEVAGDAACLVDPFDINKIRDGLQIVIGNEEYRKQLIEKGFNNASSYSLTEVAHSYAELYKYISTN